MKINKISISIVIALAISTAALAVVSVNLSREKKENLEMISELADEVDILGKKVEAHKKYRAGEAERLAVSRFKVNAFKVRYPGFTKIAEIVFDKSREYGFNPYLVMALIQVESGFDSYAVSTAGAYGLMQVNYSVWKDELNIDFNRIFDKRYNVDLGLRVLKHYYDKSGGNIFQALFRYNNGYKYNNTAYNGKIIATSFYAKRKEAEKFDTGKLKPSI